MASGVTNGLRPTTSLRRLTDLRFEIDSSNCVVIHTRGRRYQLGHHALAILEAFAAPKMLADALELLSARLPGAMAWIELTTTIEELYAAGILYDVTRGEAPLAYEGFASAATHVAMLNDRTRTDGFIRAIEEIVCPGDVVVEVGTGTGILAMTAARAGAKHVYSIEASAIADRARQLIAANGLSDRISVLSGWSSDVEIPERADVFLSETVGSTPLEERALETVCDAVRRFLKPSGRVLPSEIRIFGTPVTVPEELWQRRMFAAPTLERWRQWYGFDFEALSQGNQVGVLLDKPQRCRAWPTLAEPVLLACIDCAQESVPFVDARVEAVASTAGVANAVLISFELKLSDSVVLSTHPSRVADDNHWPVAVWLFDPVVLSQGSRVSMTYRYRVAGRSVDLQRLDD